MADELIERYRVAIRQACAALRLPSSVYYHRSTARDSTRLKARIGDIAATRVHYGYRRVRVLLQREGQIQATSRQPQTGVPAKATTLTLNFVATCRRKVSWLLPHAWLRF